MRDYLKRIFKKKLMMHSKVLLHVEVEYFLGGWGRSGHPNLDKSNCVDFPSKPLSRFDLTPELN